MSTRTIALSLLVSLALTAGVEAGLAPPAAALPNGTKVQRFARNLDFPVDMAWRKGSKQLFFTEKNTGKIRVVKRGRLKRKACVNLAVNSEGERGALGIALHPKYNKSKRNRKLYVFFTKRHPLENRVARFKVRHLRCRHRRNIVKGLGVSSSLYHNGGQLEFVGGHLFVSTGESHSPKVAQNKNRRRGKILRYNPDGSVPKKNPFNRPGDRNPVWSRGHRNPFGLTHRPGTHRIYETENGPQCDDELNRIKKGRNYGWGAGYNCGTRGVGPNPKGPLRRWTPTIVPTDPWWYRGRIKSLSGDLYMGDFKTGKLRRFVLNRKGTRIKRSRLVYDAPEGIVDVTKGPGGYLYFATPSAIYRIVKR